MAKLDDRVISLPDQMASTRTKGTKTWQEGTVKFLIDQFSWNSREKRKSKEDIDLNYDIINSKLDSKELSSSFDPLNISHEQGSTPIDFQFYNIVNNALNTLHGEELKRRSDIKAIAINPTVINQKDRQFRDKLHGYLAELSANNAPLDPKQIVNDLSEIESWKKHDLQTAHEVMANQILQLALNDPNIDFKTKKNNAFKNLTITGEEIMRVGNVGKEPMIYNVDSKNFYMIGLGESNRVEDAWAWIEECYMNPHAIIEEFGTLLTKSQISGLFSKYGAGIDMSNKYDEFPSLIDDGKVTDDGLVLFSDNSVGVFGGDNNLDKINNIKVKRIYWKSLRRLGFLTYYDEDGKQQTRFVDDSYEINEDVGEEIEYLFVNEMWQGKEVNEDFMVDIKPCDVQMRSLINPAIVKPPYVGYVMSNNNEKPRSLLDELIPYQKDFVVWMNKLKTLWLQNIGKVAGVDLALIPDGMEVDAWFEWVKTFKVNFTNSFNESNKNFLAGNMQSRNNDINLDISNEIAQAIDTLDWLKQQVETISGISRQRQGDINPREGLGTSQQAIVQSSHQTEREFSIHDGVCTRTLTVFMEYTKVLWKDEKGKRQYLLDDVSNYILDVDGELLNEGEYGIQITNSSRLFEMEQMLQQLVHASIQNGTATLSDAAKMFMSTSPSEMLNSLASAEEKRIKQQQEQQQAAAQSQEKMKQADMEMLKLKHQFEIEKLNVEWGYRLQDTQLKQEYIDNARSEDTNSNWIKDEVENDMNIRDNEIEIKKLEITKEMKNSELAAKEKIEKRKAEIAEKIARMNRSNK